MVQRNDGGAAAPRPPLQRLWGLLAAEWREIGGLGRVSLLGIAAAAVLTISLGFSITGAARTNLLQARAELVATDVAALPPLPTGDVIDPAAVAHFGIEVEHELLGGETERVKVWSPEGEILYSDDAGLVGERFRLSTPAQGAFAGRVTTHISDLDDPAHAADRAAGQLVEIYVPVERNGMVESVVEVEQRLDSLNEAMGRIRRNVWLSITFGVGVLALFLSALGLSLARRATRGRRQAERVLGSAFRAQEEERRRIVGALHDDIGQPLYRLLYGLEGSRAKLEPDDAVGEELERLEEIVRDIDSTLRSELHQLHQGLAADAGLVPALRDIAATAAAESALLIHVDVGDEPAGLSAVGRTALFRAAQEAVVNIRKHAAARTAWIRLHSDDQSVTLVVGDDGAGVKGEPGLGLTTTRERLEALGGTFAVTRRKGGGTELTATLPLRTPPS